jgi:Protein of unknown function (DUF3313)
MKPTKGALSLISLIAAAVLISACASSEPDGPTDFLASYEGFQPGPEDGPAQIWLPEGINTYEEFETSFKGYTLILLDPIIVSYQEAEVPIDPADVAKLVGRFEQAIKDNLTPEYPIVTEPGPGVVRVSIALAHIDNPSTVGAFLSTFTPVGLALSAGTAATSGEAYNSGSATMEVILSDSVTGKALAAGIDRYTGTKLGAVKDNNASYEAFEVWAKRFRKMLIGVNAN